MRAYYGRQTWLIQRPHADAGVDWGGAAQGRAAARCFAGAAQPGNLSDRAGDYASNSMTRCGARTSSTACSIRFR